MPTAQTANPPSFESVWAALQETGHLINDRVNDVLFGTGNTIYGGMTYEKTSFYSLFGSWN